MKTDQLVSPMSRPWQFGRAGASALVVFSLWAVCAGCMKSTIRGRCEPNPKSSELGSICGFQHPEDIEIFSTKEIALVSNIAVPAGSAGSIEAFSLTGAAGGRPDVRVLWPPPSCSDPAMKNGCSALPAELFAPHGMASRELDSGEVTLAVVNHQVEGKGHESIELFDVIGEGDTVELVWKDSLRFDPGVVANDVAIAEDTGEIFIANFVSHPPGPRRTIQQIMAGALGTVGLRYETGDVRKWDANARQWRRLENSDASLAAGIAVSPDGKTIYVSEAATGDILILTDRGDSLDRDRIELGGNPDNLSWALNRKQLLAAVHGEGFIGCTRGEAPCTSKWTVYSINTETLEADKRLCGDGQAIGAVSSAAEWDDTLFLGSVFDDRIGVWKGQYGATVR